MNYSSCSGTIAQNLSVQYNTMQSLTEIIQNHKEKKELGELKNHQEQVHQLINFIQPRAMSVLGKWATSLEVARQRASIMNLRQAQENFRLITAAIMELESEI